MAPTLFSLFEGGWSLSTITRNPTKTTAITYALRIPKRLWQIVPGAAPGLAFDRHQSRAQILAARFQLSPIAGDPVEAYLSSQERQKIERYQVAKRRNLFGFLWDIDRYALAPKLEWLGKDA
jgi:hypothetical protein